MSYTAAQNNSGHPTLARQSQANAGIYTTTKRHPKIQTESYNSIGDTYADPHKQHPTNSRFSGKQMATAPPKNTSGGGGYFEKMTYAAEPYSTENRYMKSQPLDQRRKGFGSGDAFKCGEFTNVKGSSQLTEKINNEAKRAPKPEGVDSLDELVQTTKPTRKVVKHLYDIGRNQCTEFDPRSSSDTYYNKLQCKSRIREVRDDGPYQVSSQAVGAGTIDLDHSNCRPMFGHKKETKNFFDKSHLGESALS